MFAEYDGKVWESLIVDELLQKAIDRRNKLRIELETLDHFIRNYADIRESQERFARQQELFPLRTRQSYRARRADENAAAMDAAERFIIDEWRPLSRSELLKRLEEAGHRIEGGDKSKVLGTNLWRSKRFYNLKGAGYWPISRPVPDEFKHLQPRESLLLDETKK